MRFRDIAPPGHEGPPRALRALGFASIIAIVGTPLVTDPKPSLHGDGLAVSFALVLMIAGLALAMRRHEWFPAARFIGRLRELLQAGDGIPTGRAGTAPVHSRRIG